MELSLCAQRACVSCCTCASLLPLGNRCRACLCRQRVGVHRRLPGGCVRHTCGVRALGCRSAQPPGPVLRVYGSPSPPALPTWGCDLARHRVATGVPSPPPPRTPCRHAWHMPACKLLSVCACACLHVHACMLGPACCAAAVSQALITGAFSIVHQSMAMGCFPRFRIHHTSDSVGGQIYISEASPCTLARAWRACACAWGLLCPTLVLRTPPVPCPRACWH